MEHKDALAKVCSELTTQPGFFARIPLTEDYHMLQNTALCTCSKSRPIIAFCKYRTPP